MAVDLPESPNNREEQYLASIAGQNVEVPKCPWSRKEAYLDAINGRLEDIDQEIQDLENNPDVTDIVDTYADLMAYDTSTLTDKDIIRVLNDETHNGESTYYRYSKATDSWTYIGSTGPKGGEQSDWDEDDSEDPAYIKNRPFYDEKVTSTIPQGTSTSSGSTPDTGYVWFIEQLMDYSLTSELSDFEDGDMVFAKITYSVNGVEKSDTGKFTLNIENDLASLDYDAPAGTRWTGAYISEVNAGDTTVRWPVSSSDASATVYITSIEYTKVKQLDAQYIPIDGDTIKVNADGELEADVQGGPTVVQTTGTSTTDVMSQNAVTSMVFRNNAKSQINIGGSTSSGSRNISIGSGATANGNDSIAIGGANAYNAPATAAYAGGIAIGAGSALDGAGGIAVGVNTVSTSTTRAGVSAIALGSGATATGGSSIALGSGSNATSKGQFDISTGTSTTAGYNNSNYRLLTGVYDGQSAHDAATVGQIGSTISDQDFATLLNGTGA